MDDRSYRGNEDRVAAFNAYRKAFTAMFEPDGQTDNEGRPIYKYVGSGSEITTIKKIENGSYGKRIY